MEKTIRKLKGLARGHLVMIAALALIITSLPSGLFSLAEEADAAKVTGISGWLESKKLSAYDMTSSRYMQIYYVDYAKERLRDDGSCTEASSPMHVYNINTGDGVNPLVFCVEHGVTQKNTANMNARDRERAEMTQAYQNAGKSYAIENIFKVLFYGPVTNSNDELFDLGYKGAITDRSLIYLMKHTCFDLDHPIDFEIISFLLENNKLDFML